MEQVEDRNFVIEKFKTVYIIWAQFIFTSFAFTQLPAFIPPGLETNPILDYLLPTGIALLAAGLFIESLFSPPRMTNDFRKNVDLLLKKHIVPKLLVLVVFECATLVGFLSYLLGGGKTNLYLLSSLAILAMLLKLPRPSAIVEQAKTVL